MNIHIIDAGTFKCDGGGMFGGIPKSMWQQQIPSDEQNRITLAMRCLLLTIGSHNILIDTGAGEKLSSEFVNESEISTNYLINALKSKGFKPEDITDVVHTHLHWDHCGGGTKYNEELKAVPTFSNARYHCAKSQWNNALDPNEIEAGAFFKQDLLPIEKSGQLNLIETETELFPGFELRIFNGHTPGMLVPVIDFKQTKLVYINDLIPFAANIDLPWIAAYDLFPVTTLEEKKAFLREAIEKQYILMFEHDVKYECATIKWDTERNPVAEHVGNLRTFL